MKKNILLLFAVAVVSIMASWLTQNAQETASAADNAPIGTVVAWSGQKNTIPSGWMECDGRPLDRSGEYKKLFDAIGTTWGGVGTTQFKIPNLKGYFLRGVDETGVVDVDSASRKDVNGAVVGGKVGSFQMDAIISHKHLDAGHGHGINNPNSGTRNGEWTDCGDSCLVLGDENTNAPLSIQAGQANLGDAVRLDNTPVNTALESRPKNADIFWIIRAK